MQHTMPKGHTISRSYYGIDKVIPDHGIGKTGGLSSAPPIPAGIQEGWSGEDWGGGRDWCGVKEGGEQGSLTWA